MPIPVECPACGKKLNAPSAGAGRRMKCPKCGGPVRIPATAAPEPESIEPLPTAVEPPVVPKPKKSGSKVPVVVGAIVAIVLGAGTLAVLTNVGKGNRRAAATTPPTDDGPMETETPPTVSTQPGVPPTKPTPESSPPTLKGSNGMQDGLPLFRFEKVTGFTGLPAVEAPFAILVAARRIDAADLDALKAVPNLASLKFQNTELGDADLFRLRGMKQLASLHVESDALTSAGVRALAALPALESFAFRGRIYADDADDFWKNVVAVPNLKRLSVEGAELNAANAKRLGGVTRLEELRLDLSKLTDGGLAELRGLTALKVLALEGSSVTDAGLKHLAPFRELRSLNLRYTRVTQASFRELPPLPKLESLAVSDASVIDMPLAGLERFDKLTRLDLRGTRVTDAGVAAFKAKRPNCEIVR